MSITVVIDISTFIWDEDHYNKNKPNYFGLLEVIPVVYEKIINHKISILFRNELYQLLYIEFPYNMAREISNEFEPLTLSFLSKTISNWSPYNNFNGDLITTIPLINKPYFSNESQIEAKSQIGHLFFDYPLKDYKFIAFNYFYDHTDNLTLKTNNESKVVETLNFSSQLDVIHFFDKYKIKFKHHTKHRRASYYDYERQEQVSPFSCYHNQGELAAQELLDKAFFYEGHYYNYDLVNNVFVRFIMTSAFEYHGHDLLDEGNNIPNQVRKKFNK